MMTLFEYDIWDGDKGVIIAPDIEHAIREFHNNYPDTPVVGYGCDDYDTETCMISELGTVSMETQLFFIHD